MKQESTIKGSGLYKRLPKQVVTKKKNNKNHGKSHNAFYD